MRATRDQLLASLNTSCTQSADCPAGGFCDVAAGSFCNFQCYTDDECPSGQLCNCLGQCSGSSTGPDGGPPPDPACPKVAATIEAAENPPRACTYDEECPYGTNCSAQTGACGHECLADSDCASDAGAQRVCDCFGRCVVTGAPPPAQPATTPSLTLSPAAIRLPAPAGGVVPVKPDFSQQNVQVTLHMTGNDPTKGPKEKVHVTAGKYVVVRCPAQSCIPDPTTNTTCPSPGNELFAKECDLQNWSWVIDPSGITASFSVSLQPSTETPAAGEASLRSWDVKFQSAGVDPTVSAVTLNYGTAPPSTNDDVVPVTSVAGGYAGTARITLDDNSPATLFLTALATPDGQHLVLYDSTHFLTPSGLLTVPLSPLPDPLWLKWLTTDVQGTPTVKGVAGFLWAAETFGQMMHKPNDTAIIGSAKVTGIPSAQNINGAYIPLSGTGVSIDYNLTPATIRSCDPSLSNPPIVCPSGFSCNSGFCTERQEEISNIDFTSITTTHFSDWLLGLSPAKIPLISLGDTLTCEYPSQIGGQTIGGFYQPPVTQYSGDFSCVENAAQTALGVVPAPLFSGIPLLSHKDWVAWAAAQPVTNTAPIQPTTPLSGDELLADCMQEILRPAPKLGELTSTGGNFSAFRAANTGPGRYFDPTSRCVALGYFLQNTWSVRFDHNPSIPILAQRFYLRLLQQWLELHAFIARQGLQTNQLDQVLASSSSADKEPSLSQSQVTKPQLLDVLMRGWGFLLAATTDFNTPLFDAIPDVDWLVHPDYRAQQFFTDPVPHPEYEQQAGLPVTMLESMAATLDVVEAYLQETNAQTYAEHTSPFSGTRDQALRQAGDAQRMALVVEQTARHAHDLACGGYPTCGLGWEDRYQQALGEFQAARGRLFKTAINFAAGFNSLNVPDNVVPLYFGDPSGTSSQYFASSDYLLNTWAAPAVSSALTLLATARQAWINQRNSEVQDQLLATDEQRRIEQIGQQYGDPILQNCGISQVAGQAAEGKDVFNYVNQGLISLRSCFIDTAPGCVPQGLPAGGSTTSSQTSALLLSQLTAPQAAHQLCLWEHLQSQLNIPFNIAGCITNHPTTWSDVSVQAGGNLISCQNGTFVFPAVTLWSDVGLGDLPPSQVLAANDECSNETTPGGLPKLTVPPSCLRGAMGEAYSRIQAANAELDTAVAQLNTALTSFNGQIQLCQQKAADDNEIQIQQATLDQLEISWGQAKINALETKETTSILGDIFSFAGDIVELVASDGAVGGQSAMHDGMALFSDAVNAPAQLDETVDEVNLAIAQEEYNSFLTDIKDNEDLAACYNTAQVQKVALDAARDTIRARVADVNTASVTLNNLYTTNVQKFSEGQAALAREANRPFDGYAHHYWLNEDVQRFKTEFEWSRRLTYLAMLAIEYEFQQSLPFRSTILGATNPDQLQDVILGLQQEQAAREINGRRPGALSLVLSLRDDILRIKDKTNVPAGERAWTAAQQFEARLSRPDFAVRDVNSNLLGQGIRFSLDPTAAGAQSGVALANRCGERLWQITATIQGDGLSPTQPGTPVLLLKRNTFSSQWCSGLSNGTPLQTSSVEPSRQLFRPNDLTAPVNDASGFTAASIYPWFNIPRTEFYLQSFQNGSSQELAGRGLYGDYVLLFPQQLINSGFPLNRVEDVLIRLDYLSVDNLPQLSQ